MVRNIRGHRIRWRTQFAWGALAGIVSAFVMLAVTTITISAFEAESDAWTFLKIVSTAVLGSGAADPLTGFDATPVIAGLLLHLAIGAVAGITFSGIIGMFDFEGWTPVALWGLLWGAVLFIGSTLVVSFGFAPAAAEDLPLASLMWGHIAFGLTTGTLLATWAERSDLDVGKNDPERVRVFESERS